MVIVKADLGFTWNELKSLKRIMAEEWGLNQDKNGDLGAWMYAFWVAKSAHITYVLYKYDVVVGLGALTVCGKKHHFLWLFLYYFTKFFLLRNKRSYNEYCNAYDKANECWKVDYDTEGDIIIVDKKYRGEGYGKLLMESLISVSKLYGNRMKIETYNDCAWKFHERYGAKRVFEKEVDGEVDSNSGEREVLFGYVINHNKECAV